MRFDFFGHEFYFLGSEAQIEKAIGMAKMYIVRPQILTMLLVVALYLVVRLGVKIARNKPLLNHVKKLSVWVYLYVILTLTLFNREAGLREVRWDFDPWLTPNGFHESAVLGGLFNICMFVPLGWLLYRYIKSEHRLSVAFLLGCVVSVATEVLQFVFSRGVTAVDDVAMNAIGVAAGAFFAFVFEKLKRMLKKVR